MLLLLITLLSVCYSQEQDQVLELALEEWHKTFYELNPAYFCEEVDIKQYTEKKWTDLSEDAQNEIIHCLWKTFWLNDDDVKSNTLYKASKTTSCDIMVAKGKWSEMSVFDKGFTHDCILKRMTMEYLKNSVPLLHWLPNSYAYDDTVRKSVEDDVFQCALIHLQFREDMKADFQTFASMRKSGVWPILNIAHYGYKSIVDEESLNEVQSELAVDDYIKWNSHLVESCDAYTSFREIGKGILDSVESDYFTILRKLVALRDQKFRIENVLLNSYTYFSKDTEWQYPE